MATQNTYECYVCRNNNFPGIRVILDGRTEDGKTIYKNPNMSAHIHKRGQPKTVITHATKEDLVLDLLRDLNIKMNRVIEMLEEIVRR